MAPLAPRREHPNASSYNDGSMSIRKSTHGTWFSELDDVLVNFRHDGPLPEPAFDEWVRELSRPAIRRFVSCAIGPVQLTSTQRKRASALAEERGLGVVVVTDDRVGRGIVTAVSWLGARIRAVSWQDVDGGGAWLGLTPARAKDLTNLVWELRRLAMMVPAAGSN
jgi:hypothetical protein